MKDYLVKLIERKEICDNTFTFTFDTGNTGYTFKAGQYAHFTVPDPVTKDKKGHSRPLSIASSPDTKGSIMVAARKGSSVFVDNLSRLPIGSEVYVSKPSGSMYITDIRSDLVFIAGGIGITPVRSIVEKILNDKSSQMIYLFYSNKSLAQAAFIDEFKQWSGENTNFIFIPLFNDDGKSKSEYEYGSIDEKILKKYLKDLNDKIFYVTGPPLMVDSIDKLLLSADVNPEKIIMEKFK
ncbi:MAG: FAD-dependent oxidoreductase [Ignavibacteria bacterium]